MDKEDVADNDPLYAAALAPPSAELPLWRVDVPDLPGCYVTGETLADVTASTPGAVEDWLAQVGVGGLPVPAPSTIDAWARSPDYPGCFWFLVARPEPVSEAGVGVRSNAATVAVEVAADPPSPRPDGVAPSGT